MAEPIDRRRLFVAACAGMFVFGIVLALLGTLFGLPEMRARLQVNLAQQGDLFLLLYFGLFLATVVVGPLIDRFGNRVVLFLSLLLISSGLVGFCWAESFRAGAVSAFLLGLGGGGVNTSTNVLVSDLYGENRGPMLNILGVFFGVGALFIPLLAASLTAYFTIAQLMLFAAALAALCMVAYGLLPFPPGREAQSFSFREAAEVVRYPGVLLFAFLLFFQSGNEASIGGWTSSYIGSMGAQPRIATWLLAGYWTALMLGRLLSACLLGGIGKAQLVLASGVGAIIGCAVLLAARSIAVMAAGVGLIGLSFAGIYPTTLAMAGDRYRRFAGTVFGVLFSVALIGGMIFPWAIGHLSQALGMRSGMLLLLVSTAMICVLIVVIMLREARAE